MDTEILLLTSTVFFIGLTFCSYYKGVTVGEEKVVIVAFLWYYLLECSMDVPETMVKRLRRMPGVVCTIRKNNRVIYFKCSHCSHLGDEGTCENLILIMKGLLEERVNNHVDV